MAFKSKYTRKEDIPSGQEGLYVEKGGIWVLDVEDLREHPDALGLKKALDTERDGRETAEARAKAYEALGLSPEAIRKLEADAAKTREDGHIKKGDIEAVVAERVANLKRDSEAKFADLESKYTKATAQLNDLVVKKAVRDEALKAGAIPEALDDIELHASALFIVEDGKPIPKRDGKVIYGKNGTDPMGVGEWVESLARTKRHLFGETQGSGSGNDGQKKPATSSGRFVDNTPDSISANLEAIAKGEKEVAVN